MQESSRSINHKLNEILSKNTLVKPKLDDARALSSAHILRANILGKDKQEKVNSIVVLAKLLECLTTATGSDDVGIPQFAQILDYELFSTLFSIISINRSSETFKAILKISVVVISGEIFGQEDAANYLPLFQSLAEYLDAIDVITSKLASEDRKIIVNSIKLVTGVIEKGLKFEFPEIITLAARLKHVSYFSTVENLVEKDDAHTRSFLQELKALYHNLNQYLNSIRFDLSIKSHQLMLNNLFLFLEVSLNEFGTPATTEEYIKSGFTDNPRQYVIDNFSILLAMDLKIFLKNPDFTFKKRFHEELMMSDHLRTFPLSWCIEKCSKMWQGIFEKRPELPILSYELLIYDSMNICLNLWQQTKAQINNKADIDKIFQLIYTNVESFEPNSGDSLENFLGSTNAKSSVEMRHIQAQQLVENLNSSWQSHFIEFNRELSEQVWKFVAEQRVMQLLRGSWVFTEDYGKLMFGNNVGTPASKYYYICLSPNRKQIYCKSFAEKGENPNYEELEKAGGIKLPEIQDIVSDTIGESLGEEDKRKNSMLISIKGTISYEKITILGANKKRLLSFYTDSDVNRFVWLDGIKMLKKLESLSKDTRKQMDSLIDIRRNTQLLNLDELDHVDDGEFLDAGELNAISTGFFYK